MSWILKKKKIERNILRLWKYYSSLSLAIVTVYIKVIYKFFLLILKNHIYAIYANKFFKFINFYRFVINLLFLNL